MPDMVDAKGNRLTLRVVLRRTQANLLLANGTITAIRECMSAQRNAYQSQ